jgi:NAD(P)-dependent dehydrogenase (short-subunit alcohol dehydrogenase family)
LTFAVYPSLAGRVVFVSGGASGIGADIVRAFARNRARVAFVDLQREAGAALVRELAADGEAIPVLVNNAANDQRHRFAEVSVEYWDQSQNVNLRHHFFAAQAVHPQMRELGFGSIINLSSIAWRAGAAEMPAYAAAKAGVVGLTRALARAFGPDNIRVNAIEPGAVRTDRQRQLWYKTPESIEAMAQRQMIKKTLLGEEIARAALFLAADDSRMITKQSLTVDAGIR